MKFSSRHFVAVIFFISSNLYTISVNAGGPWQWAMDLPSANFSPSDITLLKEAGADLLNNQQDNTQVEWNNPETGSSGSLKVLSTHMADDTKCRKISLTNHVNDVHWTRQHLLCLQADGLWKIKLE